MTANTETLHLPAIINTKKVKEFLQEEQIDFDVVLNGDYIVLLEDFTAHDIFELGQAFQKFLAR